MIFFIKSDQIGLWKPKRTQQVHNHRIYTIQYNDFIYPKLQRISIKITLISPLFPSSLRIRRKRLICIVNAIQCISVSIHIKEQNQKKNISVLQ